MLTARQLETYGDLRLDGLTGLDELTGTQLVLGGAGIGGVLGLRNAHLENKGGIALEADHLDVRVAMDCSHLQATGELRLLSRRAHRRTTELRRGRLSNEDGKALSADRLQADQDVFCSMADGQPFEATGELRLLGAHIGGQLNFAGARLSNEDGKALSADRLQADQDVLCQAMDGQPFEATGEFRLPHAHIRGQLSFAGARRRNEGGWALYAIGLHADQDVLCQAMDKQPFEANGALGLGLRGAHIGGELNFEGAQLSPSTHGSTRSTQYSRSSI
jgi:hypothetical protein